MLFSKYSRSSKSVAALALAAEALAVTAACGQNRDATPLNVTITEGQQFAHRIELPSGFRRTDQDTRELRWFEPVFEHYIFRLSASSPDALLVSACRWESPTHPPHEAPKPPFQVEVCSANSFAVDTANSFAVREAREIDWVQGVPIDGFLAMRGQYHANLREEMKRPSFLRPLPIGTELEREGYAFRGKQYIRRAKWITAFDFGASADGRLIVLAGYDMHKLSHGPFALDVFDSDPERHIVAIDAESPTDVENRLRRVSIVNSRWFVVGLSLNLRHLLLFDFKPFAEEQIK
jgi:hypothetical protein